MKTGKKTVIFVTKRIFKEFANGVPKAKIVERLNREGYRNQYGRPFNVRTVFDMLQNEKYIGNFIYHHTATETVRLEGIIKEPIIDEDLWEQVQHIRQTQNKPKYRKRNYFMTGKLKCGICGFTYCGAGGKKTKKDGKELAAYYKCAGKYKNKNGCTNTALNKEYYEKLITDTITDAILSDSAINEIATQVLNQLEIDRKAPLIPTKKLKQQLAVVLSKQEKLMELYISGDLEKDMLDRRLTGLKEEKKRLEDQIEKNEYLESSNNLKVEDVAKFLYKYKESIKEIVDEEYAQTIFNTFVEKVVVYPDTLDITLRVDFSTLGCDKVKNGGANRILPHHTFNKIVNRKLHQQRLQKRK